MELNEPVSSFMSHVKGIKTLNNICSKIINPLNYQHLFSVKSTPWDSIKLEKFKFDFKTIDRLYYINTNESNNHDRTYELLCRTCYKGKYYFVEMYAYCDDKGF